MTSAPDYYEILQVSPKADAEIIQAAYRRLAQKWHPDKNPGDPFAYERMKLLNEAYQTLSDARRRRDYDAKIGRPPRTEPRDEQSRDKYEPQGTSNVSATSSPATAKNQESQTPKPAEEEPDSWHWQVALFASAAVWAVLKAFGIGGFLCLFIGAAIGKGIAMLIVPQPKGEAPDWARGIWGSGSQQPRYWFGVAGVGVIFVVLIALIVTAANSTHPSDAPNPPQSDSEKRYRLREPRVRQSPRNADAYVESGFDLICSKEYERALKDYEQALRLDPSSTMACLRCASLLATCPDASIRDGKRALQLATTACKQSGWENGRNLDVLAAACAEAGDFENAVNYQIKALEDPDPLIKADLRDAFRQRLELYKKRIPFHLSP